MKYSNTQPISNLYFFNSSNELDELLELYNLYKEKCSKYITKKYKVYFNDTLNMLFFRRKTAHVSDHQIHELSIKSYIYL